MSKYNPVCTKLNNYYIVSYRNMSPNNPPPLAVLSVTHYKMHYTLSFAFVEKVSVMFVFR